MLPSHTAPVPRDGPKPEPEMAIWTPAAPEVGDTLVMAGTVVTVNVTGLLAMPPAVTTTAPVVAPLGTRTPMLPSLQLLASPTLVPLNVTVPLP